MQAVYRTGIARTFFMDVKDLARKSWSVPYFPCPLFFLVCPLFFPIFFRRPHHIKTPPLLRRTGSEGFHQHRLPG